MKNKVIVFGSTGYLGVNLCSFFESNNVQFSRALRKGVNYNKLSPNSVFYDINNQKELSKLLNDFDVILFAAGLNQEKCEFVEDSININVISLVKVLEASIDSEIKTFIYLSTIQVYDSILESNYNESSEVLNLKPYALSKIIAEKYLNFYSKKNKFKVIINRLSNCFSSYNNLYNINKKLVLNDFCFNAILNKEIIVKSKKNISKNFLPMSIFLKYIYFQIYNYNQKNYFEIFNLGAFSNHNLYEIANKIKYLVKNEFNYDVRLSFSSDFEMDTNQFLFSTEKINNYISIEYSFDNEILNFLKLIKSYNED